MKNMGMSAEFGLLLLCLCPVFGLPYRKLVNPCGIAYDHLGSERYRHLQAKRALTSRIREILPQINATVPQEFGEFQLDTQSWIPDSSTIDGATHFSKQLVEINRNLKYFSCALGILEKDLTHMVSTCRYHLPQFSHLVRTHRLLVCDTDAVMGALDLVQPKPGDYPTLTVEVPNDWYNMAPDCTQSGLLLSVVYSRYRYFLQTFLALLESNS